MNLLDIGRERFFFMLGIFSLQYLCRQEDGNILAVWHDALIFNGQPSTSPGISLISKLLLCLSSVPVFLFVKIKRKEIVLRVLHLSDYLFVPGTVGPHSGSFLGLVSIRIPSALGGQIVVLATKSQFNLQNLALIESA